MSDTTNPDESITGVTSTQRSLSVEAIFDILSAKERQFTALLLTQRDEGVTLEELVTHIASNSDSGDDDWERIHIGLCHCHLPKLREFSVIEYESQETIVRGANFERLTPALALVREERSIEQRKTR